MHALLDWKITAADSLANGTASSRPTGQDTGASHHECSHIVILRYESPLEFPDSIHGEAAA